MKLKLFKRKYKFTQYIPAYVDCNPVIFYYTSRKSFLKNKFIKKITNDKLFIQFFIQNNQLIAEMKIQTELESLKFKDISYKKVIGSVENEEILEFPLPSSYARIYKEGYDSGLKAGIESGKAYENGYNDGMIIAVEAVRKKILEELNQNHPTNSCVVKNET